MEYTKEENYSYARQFLKERDYTSSGQHYFLLAEKDPENAEAEFFSAYYGYVTLLSDSKFSSAGNAFRVMAKTTQRAVEVVKTSECDDSEKIMVLSAMVELYTPLTRYVFTSRISTSNSTIEGGVLGLYALGNAIRDNFASSSKAMELATTAWKEAVSLQNTFYGYKYNGVKLEEYVEEIKKYDSLYIAPNKPIMKRIIEKISGLFNKK